MLEACFAMGLAMLPILYKWMQRLISKKEPEGSMLNEHLWALVLQHLDTLQDHVRAATCCKAAWNAGLLKLDVPVHMPSEGMSHSLCIYVSLCLMQSAHIIVCPWQHEGQQRSWSA